MIELAGHRRWIAADAEDLAEAFANVSWLVELERKPRFRDRRR